MIGDVMGISRLRMGTDGEGVTTLVAFYGCPLNCKYCINNFCHETDNLFDSYRIPRSAYQADELIKILAQDEIYFLMSNGGVTFGGGEPLQQAEFIQEVCRQAPRKWKMRIETSLFAPWESVALLTDWLDEWIIDIKETQDEIYQKYTGASNRLVLANLEKLLQVVDAKKIRVRVPHIPRFNTDEDVRQSIHVLEQKGVQRIDEFDYLVVDTKQRLPYSEKD